jgi:hypothetical protein
MSYLATQLHTQLIETAQDYEVGCKQFPDAYFMSAENHEEQSLNKLAVSICNACPVKDLCLAYALEAKEPYGIWGGKTTSQRKKLIAKNLKLSKQLL